MNRTVLAGLAAVLLVPGLAFAQEGRGGPRRGPQGLPPGVWEVRKERPAPAARPEARMLLEHLKKMSQRLDRLEQAVRGLVAERHRGTQRGPQGPQAGPQAQAQAAQRFRQAMAARGGARTQGHPQLRAIVQRVQQQRGPQAMQHLRQAFRKRQGALRAGERFRGAQGHACPHCGKGVGQAQARRGPGPRGVATPPAAGRSMQRGHRGPAAPHARRGGPDRRPARGCECGGDCGGKCGGGKCEGNCGGDCGGNCGKARKAPARPTRDASMDGRRLQAENVRLKAHVKRLEMQLKQLAAKIQKLQRVG